MSDIARFYQQDIARCREGIERCEANAAHFEQEAAKLAFAPDVQGQMLAWAARYKAAAAEGQEHLAELEARLRYVGG
jgi:hypothetical protein